MLLPTLSASSELSTTSSDSGRDYCRSQGIGKGTAAVLIGTADKVWRELYFGIDHQGPKIQGLVLKVDQVSPNFIIWGWHCVLSTPNS